MEDMRPSMMYLLQLVKKTTLKCIRYKAFLLNHYRHFKKHGLPILKVQRLVSRLINRIGNSVSEAQGISRKEKEWLWQQKFV